jgi:hypothetical protein
LEQKSEEYEQNSREFKQKSKEFEKTPKNSAPEKVAASRSWRLSFCSNIRLVPKCLLVTNGVAY